MSSFPTFKILTLLISLFIVPNMSHAKSSKRVAIDKLPGLGRLGNKDDIESLIRGKRDVISDSDEEMTSTASEISDKDAEEFTTVTSFGYGDDVETSTMSFSTTVSDKFQDGGRSNESSSGIKRLLQLMKRRQYNPYEIPKGNRTNTVYYKPGIPETYPVPMTIYLNIRSVSNIDEINEQVSLDIDLITHWVDGKLYEWYFDRNQTLKEEYSQTWPQADKYVGVPLDSKILKEFWTPDIYIEKLAKVSTSEILSRSERLRFTLNGAFIYVKRMTVKVNCEMDFTYYPADTQKCDFTLRSYSYNASDLELAWRRPEGVHLMETADSNLI